MSSSVQFSLIAASEEAVAIAETLSVQARRGRVEGVTAGVEGGLPSHLRAALELLNKPISLTFVNGDGVSDGWTGRG
jgi:hypothetical protein